MSSFWIIAKARIQVSRAKLVIYTRSYSPRCDDAVLDIENYNIDFIERNLDINGIKVNELDILAKKHPDGLMSLLSTQSKYYPEIQDNMDTMTYKDALEYIVKHPAVLKTPIIYSTNTLVIGYDFEELDNLCLLMANRRKKVEIEIIEEFDNKFDI